MEYRYLHSHPGARYADLLFAGWAADERLFADLPDTGRDLIIVFDYSHPDLDLSAWPHYAGMRLLAWSMGVWAAEHTPALTALPLTERIALAGTPWPIDDERGIPSRVFNLTLSQLSGKALARFRHRMCSTDSHSYLMHHLPARSLDSMLTELEVLGSRAAEPPAVRLPWDTAVIPLHDRIFPAANQLQAWQSLQVKTHAVSGSHYEPQYFSQWRKQV